MTLAPIEAVVDCGGSLHRLLWADGALVLLDHPDAEGERLLLALGGEQPACLDLSAAWDAHREDLRILVLGPRDVSDRPRTDRTAVEAVRTGNFARSLQGRRSSMALVSPQFRHQLGGEGALDEMADHLRRHLEVLQLFTLPVAFQHRLSVAVAAAWCERDPDHPALHAALAARAGQALRAWVGERAGPTLPVEVTCRAGAPPEVRITPDGVAVVLPPTWLVDVWGPDLAVVDDQFVMEVGSGELRTVDRDGRHGSRSVCR